MAALESPALKRSNDHRAGRTPDYSIEEAVARWLTGEAGILKSYTNLVNKTRTIYPHIRGRKLTEIATAAEDVKAAGIKAGLTPATINRRLAILRRVARLAFRQWDWLDRDLAGKIRLLPGEKARHLYLTQAQVRKLAAAGPSPKPKLWRRARWAVAGWIMSIYHRFIYRHLMRLSHRFNWHHTRTCYPDGDTGTSSKTILAVMTDSTSGRVGDIPHDNDDFGRCYRLLRVFPQWRSRLPEVARCFPMWGPMVAAWDELSGLWEAYCDPAGRVGPKEYAAGKDAAAKLYARMKELANEGRIADGWERTGPGSWRKGERSRISLGKGFSVES